MAMAVSPAKKYPVFIPALDHEASRLFVTQVTVKKACFICRTRQKWAVWPAKWTFRVNPGILALLYYDYSAVVKNKRCFFPDQVYFPLVFWLTVG